MTLAEATLTQVDGGLGATRPFTRPIAIIGCSSAGTAASPEAAYTSERAVERFGYGKLTELAAVILALAGGPVILCKAATATAGAYTGLSSGHAVVAGAGGSPMTCTPSGNPVDDYSVIITVTRAGATLAAQTGAVRVSLDGGRTQLPEQAVPSSGAVVIPNTGITVTFDDTGSLTLDAGATYTFGCTAPTWDATGLAAALAALAAEVGGDSALDHEFIVVAEPTTAVTADYVRDSIDALKAGGVYRWGMVSARDQNSGESVATWKGVLEGTSPGWSGFDDNDLLVCAGAGLMDNRVIRPATMRRPVAWAIAARCGWVTTQRGEGRSGIAEHPGRVASGPMDGVGYIFHDLRVHPDLDTARFCGLYTLRGRPGYYANAVTRAQAGSDYTLLPNVRVITEGSRIGLDALQEFLNDDVRTITGGKIDPRDADAIEAFVTSKLEEGLVATGYADFVSVSVARATNVLSTRNISAALRIRPHGYTETITATIGFTTE